MAALQKFNCFTQDLAGGLHNLASGTYKLALTNTLPVSTNTVYSNLTEIAAGGGYSTGGISITITSALQTAGLLKWLVTQPTLTASGSVATFQYAVLYNTGGTKPLVAFWDNGATITLNSGDTYTPAFDLTNGVLQIGP